TRIPEENMAPSARPKTTRTTEPSRISLLALWLRRCAQTFPMYGKSLNDFPDRFDSFRDALADLDDADVNSGFEGALRTLKEFPVPAEIREQAFAARHENQRRISEETRRNQRLLEDKIKDERFEETTMEQRRQEF